MRRVVMANSRHAAEQIANDAGPEPFGFCNREQRAYRFALGVIDIDSPFAPARIGPAAQAREHAEVQVVVDVDQYPGPGTNSSGLNGQGSNGTRSGGNGNLSGSGGSGSPGGNSGGYLAPITQNCVREFWDPKFYNWLSFENDCGQAVHLTFIAKSPSDHFGPGAADLAAGQTTNTGWSQTEVAAKGNFTLFVCPAGSVAVDPNTNQAISSPNATYSCKKQ